MAVQFILGRSGTGKTHHCVTAIVDDLLRNDNTPLILLVPEQATYQAGRAILSDSKITGYSRLHVLSFDRLVYLVLGKNTARAEISRLGRAMVIQRLLRDCADKLTIFGGSASPGLGIRLSDTIAQLQQYANGPDDIENLVARLRKARVGGDDLTTAKFADIGIVFKRYIDFIKARHSGIDPDIQLADACKAILGADFIKGAKLWVDGFAGFTAGELALLTELLKVVKYAQIALCLDPANIDLVNPDKNQIDPTDLFGPTAQTYAELVERIKKCKLKLTLPLVLTKPHRFLKNSALIHIERNLFTPNPQKKVPDTFFPRIVSAPNARVEVKFVAGQITKLVREQGLRYRDIAIIASDIDQYEHYIKACFEDYRIPVFIDKRKPLNQHPAIELICSALHAVENGFPANEIFAYLKTDLLDLHRSNVDLLENYCIAFGITGDDWLSDKPWRYAAKKAEQFDEKRVDQIRQKAIAPLRQLKDQLKEKSDANGLLPAEQFVKIIFDFLETTGIRKRLAFWVEQALEKSDFATADEHRQLYARLIDVFDEMVEAFVDSPLSQSDYLAILRCAFSQMTLAFIPPNLDQVLVGSIERSRHPDLKAVFLIGTTERQFPSPLAFDNILSDEDRQTAQSAGLDLPPGLRQELANRPYLAYIAFTRASDFLCITYPALDSKLNAVVRSQFVDNLTQLFDDLKEEPITSTQPAIEDVCNEYELEDALCSNPAFLQEILADDQLARIGQRAALAIGYENKAILDDGVIGQIFGQQLTSSASRLSSFAACPYQHFAGRILDLKKRDEFKLEPLDIGEFYHRVLDNLTKRIVAEKIRFETIENAALLKILDEEIEKLSCEDSFISKFTAHGPHNAFILTNSTGYLRDCVIELSQMIKAGAFRPALSEIAFGKARPEQSRGAKSTGTDIGEFVITLDDGRRLSLNGRIDRLDIAKINDKRIALIFDYKKRSKDSFSWAEFYHGLDIQLAVYMLAILKSSGSKTLADEIAGAFYIPIEISPADTALSRLIENNNKFSHKAKGVFNGEYFRSLDSSSAKDSHFYNFFVTKEGDPYGKYNYLGALRPADFEAFLKFSSQKIAQIAGQIVSGKITAEPYRLKDKSPCEHCDYMPVCRFDWQINNYNHLDVVDKTQVLAKITITNEPE